MSCTKLKVQTWNINMRKEILTKLIKYLKWRGKQTIFPSHEVDTLLKQNILTSKNQNFEKQYCQDGTSFDCRSVKEVDDLIGDFNLNLNSIYVNSLLQRINIRWYSNTAIISRDIPNHYAGFSWKSFSGKKRLLHDEIPSASCGNDEYIAYSLKWIWLLPQQPVISRWS